MVCTVVQYIQLKQKDSETIVTLTKGQWILILSLLLHRIFLKGSPSTEPILRSVNVSRPTASKTLPKRGPESSYVGGDGRASFQRIQEGAEVNRERLRAGEFGGCLVEAPIGARGPGQRPGSHRPGGRVGGPQDSAAVSAACKPDSRRDSATTGAACLGRARNGSAPPTSRARQKLLPSLVLPPRPASAHSSLHSFHT